MIPRVLVLSNECFSRTSSNGRTLGNFFANWPKEKLAQFFISGIPSSDYCENYFQVSDRQALNALINRKDIGGKVNSESQKIGSVGGIGKGNTKRNALTMLIRECVWETGSWQKSGYWNWIKEFDPQIVLLQAGDCAFMFHLACKTAKKTQAKLVIYNSEGYYFKDFDYFKSTGVGHLLFPLFLSKLKSTIRKGYNQADYAIFNCEALRKDFCREFSVHSDVVYTATDLLDNISTKETNEDFTVTYAGNLGVGRPNSLVDIANTLQKINKDYFLDVYGSIPNDTVKKIFDECCGIRFHGQISYDEVRKKMAESDILIHAEGFDPYYIKDLKYAFSTKIADCLASNRCFLMYAPSSFAETQYLLENRAAYVASTKEELEIVLRQLTNNPETRDKYIENALGLAKKNHSNETSVALFQRILCSLV